MKKILSKTTPTTKNGLFYFVTHHLNELGEYDASPLPDFPDQHYNYGNDDAAAFSPELAGVSEGTVEEIMELLKRWQNIPSVKNKEELYAYVKNAPMVVLFSHLSKQMLKQKLSFELVELADEWLHSSGDREIIKFSYLLCGVVGLDKVRTLYDKQLYEDLFTMALCEEFTLYLCLACHLSQIRPQQKIWYLLHRTSGWGKALALALADYKTERQQLWLLYHGFELRIFWPPLATLIILESKLLKRLQEPTCTAKFYLHASEAITMYLNFLLPSIDAPEYKYSALLPQQSEIDLQEMLSNYLRLAPPHINKPENAVEILTIKNRLTEILETSSWDLLEPNACNTLIGICDQLVYSRDWQPVIDKQLFTPQNKLDINIADLAAGIDIDVWDRVFAYLHQCPTDEMALNFCMHAYVDGSEEELTRFPVLSPSRVQKLLDFFTENELVYLNDEGSLLLVLTFLLDYPGIGSSLIILALTSLYDPARGMAAMCLSRWDPKLITASVRTAVVKALHLNKDPFIKVLLEHVLTPGKNTEDLFLN
jgi:hypothetical protein